MDCWFSGKVLGSRYQDWFRNKTFYCILKICTWESILIIFLQTVLYSYSIWSVRMCVVPLPVYICSMYMVWWWWWRLCSFEYNENVDFIQSNRNWMRNLYINFLLLWWCSMWLYYTSTKHWWVEYTLYTISASQPLFGWIPIILLQAVNIFFSFFKRIQDVIWQSFFCMETLKKTISNRNQFPGVKLLSTPSVIPNFDW